MNIKALSKHPDVWVGKHKDNSMVLIGYMETVFLMLEASRETLECRSNSETVSCAASH